MLFEGRRKPGEMSRRYRLFRRAMTLLCRLLFGYRVHGGDGVPSDGPLIVASNHSQYADPVLVCVAVPRRLQWMAKKELFGFPLRKFFEFIGSFPVDREGGGRGAIRTALDFLASREVKSGVVVLALRSGASVLPVHVGKLPGPVSRLRGQRLHIFVGEPVHLDPAMRGGAAYRAAADEIMHTIYALPQRQAQESL
jgi:1-acyl-sn-glycerol-3-phosphate acyltransferase